MAFMVPVCVDYCSPTKALIFQEINGAQLPYWRKDAIREQCKAAQRTLDSYKKLADAAIAEKVTFQLTKNLGSTQLQFQVLSEAKELAQGDQQDVIVHVFSSGASSKVGYLLGKAVRWIFGI